MVVNISRNDWANFSHNNAMALRSVGIDARAFVLNKHQFGYENQAECVSEAEMREYCKKATVINFIHNDIDLFNKLHHWNEDAKKIVTYTGTAYRNEPERHNKTFNNVVDLSLTDQTEFMQLGAKNIHYISTAIDTDKISSDKLASKKLIFGHYPSNSEVKGTRKILEMMQQFQIDCDFDCDTKILSHKESLERMAKCDVYIELFKPELNGKPYGCFGVTAFEAASLGKIVVTQNINPGVYKDVYGQTCFMIPETEKQFEIAIKFLINQHKLNPQNTFKMQMMHRESMIKIHSYKAIGEQMLNLING